MIEVYGIIRKLGATSKYKGYYYVADAVKMAQGIHERPVKVTKDIYPAIARKYKSTPSNVEHNIRTLVNLCWTNTIKIHWKKLPDVQWWISLLTVNL